LHLPSQELTLECSNLHTYNGLALWGQLQSGKWTTEEAEGEERRCIHHLSSDGKTQLAYSEWMQLLGSGFEVLSCVQLIVREGCSWEDYPVSLYFEEHKCGCKKWMSAFECILRTQ